MDYKKAGVDIEAGYKSVELMKEHIKGTMISHVQVENHYSSLIILHVVRMNLRRLLQ